MNLEKRFFDQNISIINELRQHAPSDDKLLAIPYYISFADPFLSSFCQHTADKDPRRNNLLVGMNLLSLLKHLNCVLSKVYASGQFIFENHNKPITDLNQYEIDSKVHTHSCILQEYQYSLREFVLTLKIAVDQLIILIPLHLKNNHPCNGGIGDFLMHWNSHWDDHKKFLTGLNIGANYLKHHRYQFEHPFQELNLNPPSLLVIVENNDKKKYCLNFKEAFANNLQYSHDNKHIWCLIGCDLLVDGFNDFYKKLNLQ